MVFYNSSPTATDFSVWSGDNTASNTSPTVSTTSTVSVRPPKWTVIRNFDAASNTSPTATTNYEPPSKEGTVVSFTAPDKVPEPAIEWLPEVCSRQNAVPILPVCIPVRVSRQNGFLKYVRWTRAPTV